MLFAGESEQASTYLPADEPTESSLPFDVVVSQSGVTDGCSACLSRSGWFFEEKLVNFCECLCYFLVQAVILCEKPYREAFDSFRASN